MKSSNWSRKTNSVPQVLSETSLPVLSLGDGETDSGKGVQGLDPGVHRAPPPPGKGRWALGVGGDMLTTMPLLPVTQLPFVLRGPQM